DLAHAPAHEVAPPRTFAEVVESQAKRLTAYQNDAYSNQYRSFLTEIGDILKTRDLGNCEAFLTEVARGLGRLMAYKDEYEVARLYTDPAFSLGLDDQFAGKPKLKIHLAPPLIVRRKDARTGRPRKIAFPGWLAFPLFRLLTRMKGLRGTALDVFGYTTERRMERALISKYRDLVRGVAENVTGKTMQPAVEIAASAELVLGYGPVKDAGVAQFRERVAQLLPQLDADEERVAEPA
ncbi:MAG: DUF6537 domain-containing protein, partial [Rhizobiaceae bacterium]